MKSFVEKDPEQARLLLISHPQVAEALFHMQKLLGMTQQGKAPIRQPEAPAAQASLSNPQYPNQQLQHKINPNPITQPVAPQVAQTSPGHQLLMNPPPSYVGAQVIAVHPSQLQNIPGGKIPVHGQPAVAAPQLAPTSVPNPPSVALQNVPEQLLQQVMNLTPEQLGNLPSERRAQIEQLRMQLSRR
uniref:Transcription termination and cleavage factor C-terminal domain-containing protein n=1 Tax=Fibrocapsa japonica TaxID=94617 RepID=A0A7S2XZU0_9STRA